MTKRKTTIWSVVVWVAICVLIAVAVVEVAEGDWTGAVATTVLIMLGLHSKYLEHKGH